MKIFLFFFIFLIHFFSFSQEAVEEIYGYVKVFSAEGKSKASIHSNILEWVGKNFESPDESIQYNDENKIILDHKFKMSPKLIQTSQNTTTNYRVSSSLVFLLKDNRFRVEMKLDDIYSFDGKKRDPKSTWAIASNQVDQNYVGNLLFDGFLNVKQYRAYDFSYKSDDLKSNVKSKKASKYVDKEIKKGIYLNRVKKVANDLNSEIISVFNSIDSHFKNQSSIEDW